MKREDDSLLTLPAATLAAHAAPTTDEALDLGPLVYVRSDAPFDITGSKPRRTPLLAVIATCITVPLAAAAALEQAWGTLAMVGGTLALSLWSARDKTSLQRRRLRRAIAAAPTEIAAGWGPSARRLTGIVERDGRSFAAVGSDVDAVFSRTTFFEANGDGEIDPFAPVKEDVRGVRFRIRLPDGSALLIEPASLKPLDPPKRLEPLSDELRRALGAATRGFFEGPRRVYQQIIAPGDVVEIVGRLEIDVSPRGDAPPGRGTPVLRSLVGAGGHEVPIRVLAPNERHVVAQIGQEAR